MDYSKKDYIPPQLSDYYPKVVLRLLQRIVRDENKKIILFGFSANMKWLLRLLKEKNISPVLCDWRKNYINYDCAGQNLIDVNDLKDDENSLLIICLEEINSLKEGISYLQDLNMNRIKVIYDRTDPNLPFRQEEPFKSISKKARERAVSMISDAQLFDLIQFVSQTKDVEGDVVEFGSLYGGSGAVIAEAINYYGKKAIWLFDTFEGIPQSKYGLDYHWNNSFSDNSFCEVRDAFSDLKNVNVIKGNIIDTYKTISNSISFGYLASDTYESGEVLLNFMWSKLSVGGIIAVCDYGSFPNALPLTVYVDKFVKKIMDKAFVYRPDRCGIFIKRTLL